MSPSLTCPCARIAVLALMPFAAMPAATAQSTTATTPSAASNASAGNSVAARCQPLSGEFKAACEIRVMGSGAAGSASPPEVKIVAQPSDADRARADTQQAQQSSQQPSTPVVVVPLPAAR